MTKTFNNKSDTPIPLQNIPTLEQTSRLFRDKVYTSRTLILPGGASLSVAKGRVNATTDEQLQYLSTHPDFERLTE